MAPTVCGSPAGLGFSTPSTTCAHSLRQPHPAGSKSDHRQRHYGLGSASPSFFFCFCLRTQRQLVPLVALFVREYVRTITFFFRFPLPITSQLSAKHSQHPSVASCVLGITRFDDVGALPQLGFFTTTGLCRSSEFSRQPLNLASIASDLFAPPSRPSSWGLGALTTSARLRSSGFQRRSILPHGALVDIALQAFHDPI